MSSTRTIENFVPKKINLKNLEENRSRSRHNVEGFFCRCTLFRLAKPAFFFLVPEEGWFGQPKYSTPTKISFYVVSTSASIFFILYVKPI